MKSYIDWQPEEDRYLRSGERILHEQIHDIKYSHQNFMARQDRLEYLQVGEEIAGRLISGTVLDIGCGNGYSSVHLCKTRDIEQVHAMECDVPAVDKLIRANFNNNNIPEELYELILGSFNKIPNKNYYDFVISLGSIHHSSNLLVTMREVYDCLKPGGFFIAHEPYLIDETQDTARAFLAECTPEFYVFNSEKKLTYRGRFDESTPGNGKEVNGKDLIEAIKSAKNNYKSDGDQIPSMGCNIKWKT